MSHAAAQHSAAGSDSVNSPMPVMSVASDRVSSRIFA